MITYKVYNNNFREWDTFIDQSINGTIFHKQQFLSYHINRDFNNHSLLFYKKNILIAVFPASIIENILISHPGASFGGIIYSRISLNDLLQILDLIEEYAIKHKCINITMTPTPVIYNHKDESLSYALRWKKYEEKEQYFASIIPIQNNLHNQINQIIKNKSRTQKYYNNIIKKYNLEIVWINEFNEFYPILKENKKKYNGKPTHTLDELNKINTLLPNAIKLLAIKKDGAVIGGNMIFMAKENIGIIFYNMIDYQFSAMQISTIQILESIKWAHENNIKYLDFGVSHESGEQHLLEPKMSLIKFKEEFGSFGVVRSVLSKNINGE